MWTAFGGGERFRDATGVMTRNVAREGLSGILALFVTCQSLLMPMEGGGVGAKSVESIAA